MNWKNSSSLQGKLVKNSFPDLDYDSAQTVRIKVMQRDKILAETQVDDITAKGKIFTIDYQFSSVKDNIVVVFSNDDNPQQFNLDNSIEVRDLIFDDLFSLSRLTYMGEMRNCNEVIINTNCLFGTGTLTYKISLPIIGTVLSYETTPSFTHRLP